MEGGGSWTPPRKKLVGGGDMETTTTSTTAEEGERKRYPDPYERIIGWKNQTEELKRTVFGYGALAMEEMVLLFRSLEGPNQPLALVPSGMVGRFTMLFETVEMAKKMMERKHLVWKGVKYPLRYGIPEWYYTIRVPFFYLRIQEVMEAVEDKVGRNHVLDGEYMMDGSGMVPSQIRVVLDIRGPEWVKLKKDGKEYVLFLRGIGVHQEIQTLNPPKPTPTKKSEKKKRQKKKKEEKKKEEEKQEPAAAPPTSVSQPPPQGKLSGKELWDREVEKVKKKKGKEPQKPQAPIPVIQVKKGAATKRQGSPSYVETVKNPEKRKRADKGNPIVQMALTEWEESNLKRAPTPTKTTPQDAEDVDPKNRKADPRKIEPQAEGGKKK